MEKLELIQQYTGVLQTYTQKGLITQPLDSANSNIYGSGIAAGEVIVPVVETSPLKDYDRATGFKEGVIEVKKQTLKLAYDRGISFDIDQVTDMETAFIQSTEGIKTFINAHVIPEVDAARFARYASGAGVKKTGELSDSRAVLEAIEAGRIAMAQSHVDVRNMYLFVTYNNLAKLEGAFTRTIQNGENSIAPDVLNYRGVKVIPVPDALFTQDVTFNDSGFAAGTNQIEFMLIDPNAVRQIIKHEALHVIDPAAHNTKDAWRFQYRIHHDAFVLEPRKIGVYAHTKQ